MKKITTHEIALSGIITAISILFGMFAHFRFMGNGVFLISIMLFIAAFFIKMPLYIISCAISVFFADLYNGYLLYSYVSIIAYLIGMTVFKCFQLTNKFWLYIVGIILTSIIITCVYYLFDMFYFDRAVSLKNLYANLLQAGICFSIAIIIYYPAQRVKEQVNGIIKK